MGFLSSTQKATAENIYSKMRLAKKDGRVHVVMVTSFSQVANQNFSCDSKYTTEIDTILTAMQKDGYEIIDVKFNSLPGQGLSGNRTGFSTLITYC